MRFWLSGLLLLIISVSIVQPTHAQTSTPPFAEESCGRDLIFAPDNVTLICGRVYVPENYDDPNSDLLALYVVVFHQDGVIPAEDPMVYLHGGPGNSAIYSVLRSWNSYASYVRDRDLIVFDLRGTGLSEPSLSCLEVNDLEEYTLDAWTAQMNLCRDRLTDTGVDLTTYTSAIFAQDMDLIRQALGYEKWNLLGISYGTRLALTALRDNPDPLRSVILDSVYPPEIDLYEYRAWSAQRAFSALFDACRQEIACNTAYPNLEADFYALVDQLNMIQPPNRYFVPDEDRVPQGDRLVRSLFQGLYRTEIIPSFPRILDELTAGSSPDYDYFELDLLSSLDFSPYNSAIRYVLECAEELPFNDQSLVATSSTHDVLNQFGLATSNDMFALCQTWTTDEPPLLENMPVYSDVPVFIMAGEFDPITPPQWGLKTHENLSNSTFVIFPRAGHGISLVRGCSTQLALTFLNAPDSRLNTECVNNVTPFAVRGVLEFEPYSSLMYQFESIRPDAWVEDSQFNGNFQPISNPFTNLAQLTYYDYDVARSKAFLEDFYDINFRQHDHFSYESDWLTWDVYAVDEMAMYFAFAQNGDNTHLVSLYSPVTEYTVIRKQVLIPVLEAFHPFDLD